MKIILNKFDIFFIMYDNNEEIKNLCIEVAMQMSNIGSWQTMNYMKGNHRRTCC